MAEVRSRLAHIGGTKIFGVVAIGGAPISKLTNNNKLATKRACGLVYYGGTPTLAPKCKSPVRNYQLKGQYYPSSSPKKQAASRQTTTSLEA